MKTIVLMLPSLMFLIAGVLQYLKEGKIVFLVLSMAFFCIGVVFVANGRAAAHKAQLADAGNQADNARPPSP